MEQVSTCFSIGFFSAKIYKKNISSQSEKKTKIVLFPSIYNWISHVHTIKNKETKKINIPTHNCISTLDSLYLKRGCGQFLLPRPFKKVSLQKQNMPKTLSNTTSKILFLFKWPFPGRQDLFFLLILVYRSRRILLFGCRPWRMGYCCQWKQIFNIWK